MNTLLKLALALLIISSTILGFSNSVNAENISFNLTEKLTKEEKNLLASARKELAKENYEEAKVKYLQLVEINPASDVYNYETGLSYYFSTFERAKSIPYFENALKNSKNDTIPELKYYLGRAYHINGQFEKSVSIALEIPA